MKFLCYLLLASTPLLYAPIEIRHIKQAYPNKKTRALLESGRSVIVAFDLDETIITCKSRVEWQKEHIRMLVEHVVTTQEIAALDAVALISNICYWKKSKITRSIVEPEIHNLLGYLARNNYDTVGLTTRDAAYTNLAEQQLAHAKIAFTMKNYRKRDISTQGNKPGTCIRYKNGIIYTGGTSKGDAFLWTLKKKKINPAHVIFIDNKLKNVKDVEEKLTQAGIPCTAYHYTYLAHEKLDKISTLQIFDRFHREYLLHKNRMQQSNVARL